MSNHEIRCKAWRLYRENVVGLLILALGYTTLQSIIQFVWEQILGWNQGLFVLVAWLLLSPLTLGAALCLTHLWRTETKPNYADLTAFYRSIDGWGGAIVLYLIQCATIVLPLFIPLAMSMSITILLFHTGLIVLALIVCVVVITWLFLRLYMCEVLFVSEEAMSATEAIKDSFFRMSGQVSNLLCMLFVVNLPNLIISLVVAMLQPVGLGIHFALLVFKMFYAPFPLMSGIGWIVERLNDEEQPEEVSGPPSNPLLRDIANDLGKSGHQPGMQDKS